MDMKMTGKEATEELSSFVFSTTVVFVTGVIFFVARSYIRKTIKCPSDARIENKTVIITGANSGIGKATSLELAKRGGRIILACRSEKKGDAVARYIRSQTRNPNVFVKRLDLASFASIREFVHELTQEQHSINILINNAAYMGPRGSTEDGIEKCFGVNYLGHFYLTYLLMEHLKKCAPSRIINIISGSYKEAKLDLNDMGLVKGYDIYGAYSRSKLCVLMLTYILHRKLYNDVVTAVGVHPGAVHTDLMRNWPGIGGFLLRIVARVFFKSPQDGCQSVIYSAVAENIKDCNGQIIYNCSTMPIEGVPKNRDLQDDLWERSLKLCNIDEDVSTMNDPKVLEE